MIAAASAIVVVAVVVGLVLALGSGGDGGAPPPTSGATRSEADVQERVALTKTLAPLMLADQALALAVSSNSPPAEIEVAAARVRAKAHRAGRGLGTHKRLLRLTILTGRLAAAIAAEASRPSPQHLATYRRQAGAYTRAAVAVLPAVPLVEVTRPLTELTFSPV